MHVVSHGEVEFGLSEQATHLHLVHLSSGRCYNFRMANLNAIVKQLQEERDRIDAALKALTSLTSTDRRSTTNNAGSPKRRFSAATRRRMAAAQKARWAKLQSSKK